MADKYDLAALQPAAAYERGTFTTMFEFSGRPDLVCKRVDQLLVGPDFDGLSTRPRRVDWYTREQFFGIPGRDLAILHDAKYGLARFIPMTELAWGLDGRGIERGFIIQERVTGTPLSELRGISHQLAAEIDEMLAGLLAIGIDHSGPPQLGRRGHLPDVLVSGLLRNVIVGTTASDPVVRPRFVDTHPVFAAREFRELWALVGRGDGGPCNRRVGVPIRASLCGA